MNDITHASFWVVASGARRSRFGVGGRSWFSASINGGCMDRALLVRLTKEQLRAGKTLVA